MSIKKLRKKNIVDLNLYLLSILREKFNLRMQLGSGKLKQTHLLKKVRRNIARIKTIISEKKI
ncbi:50S ribosomal protein L29 [Buchnera aphidicola (Mollitrichosiphum nigrofasciatum)]|uniref:50S ribosomal protein L29 n=1 Tax=Buchnera aphidicola TaxID=9 RepID=UPI0031B7ECAD